MKGLITRNKDEGVESEIKGRVERRTSRPLKYRAKGRVEQEERERERERERVKRPGLRTLGEEVKECSHAERRQGESDQRELGKKRGKTERTRQQKWRKGGGRERREGGKGSERRGDAERKRKTVHSQHKPPILFHHKLLSSTRK